MTRHHSGLPSSLPDGRIAHRRGLTLFEVIVVICCLGMLAAFFLPATRRSREAARRTQCKIHLKHIGLALHNYHDVYEGFPPARMTEGNGMPPHSWRTRSLPFVDQQPLSGIVDWSQSWDDPANAEAASAIVATYVCPMSDSVSNQSSYVGVDGPQASFPAEQSRNLEEITDGTSNTVMVVEAAREPSIAWMSLQDGGTEWLSNFAPESDLLHEGGIQVLIADGSVRFLSSELDAPLREALATVDGGETIGDF